MIVTKFFQKIGFTPTNRDVYILIIKKKGELIIIDVYIDDAALRSRSINTLELLKNQLLKKFNKTDLRKAKTIIRLEIIRNLSVRI